MTEAAAAARQPEPTEFLQIWSDSLSQVLGQITGSPISCIVRAEPSADLAAADPGDLCLWGVVTSSGALRGEMSVRLAGATVLRLAQTFMSEPATPEALPTADHRDAVVELLRQVSGFVSTAAKARWGEIQLLVELGPAAPSWASAATFWLQAGEEGSASMLLEVGLSAALVAELREKAEAVKPETASTPALASTPVPSSAPSPDLPPGMGTLDLLMDVQLAMTLRFGTRRLLLREVLDLSAGAVIELDRKVQEPVDLLLDGRLVARGEVVVIEGNYGLRVTDVSPLGPG
jgi:flagellar motor switch protein FliN/FliY